MDLECKKVKINNYRIKIKKLRKLENFRKYIDYGYKYKFLSSVIKNNDLIDSILSVDNKKIMENLSDVSELSNELKIYCLLYLYCSDLYSSDLNHSISSLDIHGILLFIIV